MEVEPLTDPAQATGQFKLLDIYRRQRREKGVENISTDDLWAEASIRIRLLELECRMVINILGEEVIRSYEQR